MATEICFSDLSAQDRLCETCGGIDVHFPGHLKQSRHHPQIFLGQHFEVATRKHCPLCRLVVSAILGEGDVLSSFHNDSELNIKPDDHILLLPRPAGFTVKIENASGSARLGADLRLVFDVKRVEDRGLENFTCRRVEGNQINLDIVYGWLSICEASHLGCVRSLGRSNDSTGYARSMLEVIRAIDVQQLCVVEIPTTTEYLTLSYVWGDVPTLRLTKENLLYLTTEKCLQRLWSAVPRTITDAIELVQGLGKRYLWVDTLCLISNDSSDMQRGIQGMDLIYERSYLNIIAAAGSDASFGLPGVRYASRNLNQKIEEIRPGLSLGICHSLFSYMACSRYTSRGWTFQEQLLPKRSIIFINDQIYWSCTYEGTPWREDGNKTTHSNEPKAGRFVEPHESPSAADHWVRFVRVIEEYTKRKLSYDGDALNAVAGVLNRLSAQMKTHTVQGLPINYFDRAMLFYWNSRWPNDGASRRRHAFPSYSWAGWREEVYYNPFDTDGFEAGEWDRDNTWICWHQIPQSKGTIKIMDTLSNPTEKNLRRRILKKNFKQFSPEESDFQPTLYKLATLSASTSRDYPLLDFWTMMVYFRPQSGIEERLSCIASKYRLVDQGGTIAGEVQLRCDLSIITSGLPLELLLLSEGIKTSSDFKLPGRYFVMAVYLINAVKERIGIGWIKKEALAMSFPPGPIWKEILLG